MFFSKTKIILSLIPLFMLFVLCGCGKEFEQEHTSLQRFFLERILPSPAETKGEVEESERELIAFNGYGWVDIGGLPRFAKKQSAGEQKSDKQSRKIILTESEQKLVNLVKPKGNLEGYALVKYSLNSRPKDKNGLELKLFLSQYPIDYLKNTTAKENNKNEEQTEKSSGKNTKKNEKKDVSLPKTAKNSQKKVEKQKKTSLIIVKPFAKISGKDEKGKLLGQIITQGLRVEIVSTSKNAGEKLLKLLERKIRSEIERERLALAEFAQDRAKAPPKKVGLSGAWGHLERHIDLDEEEYQPIRLKF